MSSIPRSVSFLGEVSGNHLQYSRLGNPMDRGPWRTTKHDVAELYITEQLNNSNKMYYMHIYCIWPCICMLLWKLLTTKIMSSIFSLFLEHFLRFLTWFSKENFYFAFFLSPIFLHRLHPHIHLTHELLYMSLRNENSWLFLIFLPSDIIHLYRPLLFSLRMKETTILCKNPFHTWDYYFEYHHSLLP